VSARRQTDLRPADSDRRVARQLALIQDDAAFVEGGRGDPRALLHEARHELGADIVRANLYMPRLKRSMRLAARHGRMPRGRSIFLTEYGIQSRPPDPFGASPRQQARWLNESERLVWSDRRVGGLSAS
jgi:hypothetical protein